MKTSSAFLLSLLSIGCLENKTDEEPEDTGIELSGILGTLDCTDWYIDVWGVTLEEGDALHVQVDTVSDATSFDPVLLVSWEENVPFENYEIWMDDNMECTYSPPAEAVDGECPELNWTANQTGTLHLVVDVAQFPCASDTVEYRLTVEVNGAEVTPELAWDDYLDDF